MISSSQYEYIIPEFSHDTVNAGSHLHFQDRVIGTCIGSRKETTYMSMEEGRGDEMFTGPLLSKA
jgi:hypothetical protein